MSLATQTSTPAEPSSATPKPYPGAQWSSLFLPQTTRAALAIEAEKNLLRHGSIYTQTTEMEVEHKQVQINESDYINTLIMRPKAKVSPGPGSGPDSTLPPGPKRVLVMAHGYGAGLGFFYRNYAALKVLQGWEIYSIDWLGMANSSRARQLPRIDRNQSVLEATQQTEDYFVESLEEWRTATGIDEMTLMGHSLGGYLSTCYAIKYPKRVNKLILVSPAGVGKQPPETVQPRRSLLFTVARWLWEGSVTPQQLIRTLGPFGTNLVSNYANRRFEYLVEQEKTDLTNYIHSISVLPGCGEHVLSRILAPGAWARVPLHDRISKLSMPTTFIYGDDDWMDYKAGIEAAKTMSVPVRVATLRDAGHQLYLDQPETFNRYLISELTDASANLNFADATHHYVSE
ncbi:Alpha/Beta hydrolase protein [Polychytrium aggregatum]|uniref:Alpha/Beta hydrolase protein n=1 Tax=Polychytrium aggregatum TaxID=110093 RepID=UPI0022FEE8C6|nr:Alpha/Beta hydrolase protein [Polychytrium aggregatum]KAI9197373.1 Alpha/Beta hydrolase protein [Polychytrium aggregatum]